VRRLFHFEKKAHPVASPEVFSRRLLLNGLVALATIGLALAVGLAGYMAFEAMGFVDAFANAAMIISGMGQLSPLQTDGGKIFAGVYAIFCGLLIFGVAGLILAPVFHRILHSFHVDENDP
jgi:ABC-type branched-subunit amino acid transport system permease subunit